MKSLNKFNIDLSSDSSAYVERYGLLMQASSECTCDYNLKTNELYLSESFKTVFGIKPISVDQNRALYISHIHPDDYHRVNEELNDALHNSTELNFNIEYRLIKGDGDYAYIQDKLIILRDEENKPYRILSIIKDFSSEYFYKQIESIEREVMELSMDEDANLKEIVEFYLLKLERIFPSMKASVLKIKNNRIENISSPSIPVGYINAISGLEIGDNRGSCGTSAFTKKIVIVEDIENDIRWADFKDIAKKHNLASCWSQPIFNTKNEVVATFANYYADKRTPNRWEAYAIDRSQKLLSLVISKFDYIDRIQSSNDKFNFVSQLTSDAIFEWDIINKQIIWGDGLERIFGHQIDHDKKYPSSHWNTLVHPNDFERVQKYLDEFIDHGKSDIWEIEYKFAKSDQTYAFVKEMGHVLRDEDGHAIKMYGIIRDISDSVLGSIVKQLQNEISIIFKEKVLLNEALNQLLDLLLHFSYFDTAEIWNYSKDFKHINLIATKAKTPEFKEFFSLSKEIKQFKREEGLPGKILKNKEVEVWNDLANSDIFLRKEAAKAVGLNAAIGIPLMYKKKSFGALMFCNSSLIDKNDTTLKIINELIEFIGAEIIRKQQEEEMFLLFESSPDILTILSPNGYFTRVNPAFCELLGYSAEYITSIPFTQFIHPEDLEKTNIEYQETISDKKLANNFINRYKTKYGNYIWISWNTSELFGDEGYAFAYGRDITHIVELQNLLNSATQLSRVGGWELDLSSKNNGAIYWSKITKEIVGVDEDYTPTLAEALNFYTEESVEKVKAVLKELIENGTEFDIELQLKCNDGSLKWVRSIGQSERMNNECVKIYGSYQDIDKQKKVELELSKTLAEKNYILDSIGDAFIAMDNEWRVTYWNKQAENLLYKTRDEVLGRNLWDIFPESIGSHSYHQYKKAKKENISVHFEDYHPLTNHWFEATAYPSENGITIYFKDINERKFNELQILESEKRYSDIFHLSPQPMWIIDIQKATFLDVNNAALEQYGYSKEEFMTMNVGDLRPDEDKEKVFELLKDNREHNIFENIGIWTHIRKDKSRLKVEIRSKNITFKNLQAKIILATDMTERLNHLEALENQNKKLKEIAWLQSHVVRAPLARLMGLIDIVLDEEIPDYEKDMAYSYFKQSAKDLDVVITDIINKSQEVQKNG